MLVSERVEEQGSGRPVLALLVVAVENRRLLLWATGAGALLGLLTALLLPPQFTAVTQIMPPQQAKPAVSAALGQLGDLAGLMGRDNMQNSSALFVSLLQSSTVADRLIARFDLMQVYGTRLNSRSRSALASHSEISASKQGIISIRVSDRAAARAAALANAYVEELFHLNQSLAIGEAAQRRRFFETQLSEVRTRLNAAEDGLKDTQKVTGIIQLDAQGKVYTAAAARLRAMLASAEAEQSLMQNAATRNYSEYQKLQRVIAALAARLHRLEQDRASTGSQLTAGEMADTSLEYVRKFREVKYQEAIFEALAKQLEAARIDEARSASLIQVIDRADTPDHKSSPNRLLIVLTGTLLGVMSGAAPVALRRRLARLQADQRAGEEINYLRQALFDWRLRRS